VYGGDPIVVHDALERLRSWELLDVFNLDDIFRGNAFLVDEVSEARSQELTRNDEIELWRRRRGAF
jgi:hypothetical protein